MTSKWDKYTRLGINTASALTSFGFGAAKFGTKLGFSVTRAVASTTVSLTASTVDYALFGGATHAGPILGTAVASAITLIESIALAPLTLGETLTSTSIIAAHSSIDTLSAIFSGSEEASFSLASFVGLVKREWNEPVMSEYLPEERYGVGEIVKALVAWGALQGVTSEWTEKRWFENVREIEVGGWEEEEEQGSRVRKDSRVRVRKDVIYPGNRGQIITADIGEVPPGQGLSGSSTPASTPSSTPISGIPASSYTNSFFPGTQFPTPPHSTSFHLPPPRPSNAQTKSTLRRLSKLVLAGYGGASLLFFGVSLDPTSSPSTSGPIPIPTTTEENQRNAEEANLARAVDEAETEAISPSTPTSPSTLTAKVDKAKEVAYSWWNVLLGKHDRDIFERFASHDLGDGDDVTRKAEREVERDVVEERKRKISAVVGNERLMPRFWVLRDHGRKQVVLVLRGTMSLNELAVDLTCDPEDFEPATTHPPQHQHTNAIPEDPLDAELDDIPGSFPLDAQFPPFPRSRPRTLSTASSISTFGGTSKYQVHGGMLKMARVMGGKGKPVHVAVREALKRNRGYELVLCGHSLGSGVAALLGLIWADPKTCLTVPSSGLPAGRRVSVYCFAPPCLTSPALSKLSSSLITSFVYSNDIVSRLSLGSVRDLSRVGAWLCYAQGKEVDDGYKGVTRRAVKWKAGFGAEGDEEWFLSIRKTLEANMCMANLFPPGRVWWGIRDGDLCAENRRYSALEKEKLRLFEVMDVEKVFGQMLFARDMLSSHLPHQYDKVIHELS